MTEWIRVQVGGKEFTAARSTLERLEYFRIVLSETWTNERAALQIDRDPKAFRALLNHLRDPRYVFPSKYWPELEFFQPSQPTAETEAKVIVEDDRELVEGVDAKGLVPMVITTGSSLLCRTLPQQPSPFITPYLETNFKCGNVRRLALNDVITIDESHLEKFEVITGLELKLNGPVTAIQSIKLYRGTQLINVLEHDAVMALHQIFDGRQHSLRLLDLFGAKGAIHGIQFRAWYTQLQVEHFASLTNMRWEIAIDAAIINAVWLKVEAELYERLQPHFYELPEPEKAPFICYEFMMHPVMGRTTIQANITQYNLKCEFGLLRSLIIVLEVNCNRIQAERLEIRCGGNCFAQLMGSECQRDGIYHLKFDNDLDMGRIGQLRLDIYGAMGASLLVIGEQRHFNLEPPIAGLNRTCTYEPKDWLDEIHSSQ